MQLQPTLKIENPDSLVKFKTAESRIIAGPPTIIRFLDQVQSYYVHPYKCTSQVTVGNFSYSNVRLNFKCAYEECELCAEDHLIKKRYCYPVLNRDKCELFVLDLSRSEFNNFEKYCDKQKITKIHEDDFTLMAHIFMGNTAIFQRGDTDELEAKEINRIMALSSYWLDEYLEDFPTFTEAKDNKTAQKIWLPDGSWALECDKCGFNAQWADPNQSDGSFICGQCRIFG